MKSYTTKRMSIHLRWQGDMGEAGLFEAIAEALQKGGVLKEAGIITIEAESPELSGSVVVFIVPQEEQIKVELEPGYPDKESKLEVEFLDLSSKAITLGYKEDVGAEPQI